MQDQPINDDLSGNENGIQIGIEEDSDQEMVLESNEPEDIVGHEICKEMVEESSIDQGKEESQEI